MSPTERLEADLRAVVEDGPSDPAERERLVDEALRRAEAALVDSDTAH